MIFFSLSTDVCESPSVWFTCVEETRVAPGRVAAERVLLKRCDSSEPVLLPRRCLMCGRSFAAAIKHSKATDQDFCSGDCAFSFALHAENYAHRTLRVRALWQR